MVTRIAPVFCLTLILLFGWCQADTEPPHPASDLQPLLAQQTLVVALVNIDYPPLFVLSQTGELTGIAIDLVQDLAQELGVRVEWLRKTPSFNGLIDMVSQGEADIGLATSVTLSRAKKVRFTQPYMTLNMALLLNRLNLIKEGLTTELKSLADLRHTTQTIGLLTGSAYRVYAQHHFPQATLREYPSLPDLLTAVQRGELLAAVRNDLTAKLYLHRHPEVILKLQLFVDPNAKDYLAFPVRPDRPHLLDWLNTYLLLKDARWSSRDLLQQGKRLQSTN